MKLDIKRKCIKDFSFKFHRVINNKSWSDVEEVAEIKKGNIYFTSAIRDDNYVWVFSNFCFSVPVEYFLNRRYP